MSVTPHAHRIGIHRRELLQVGFSALCGAGALSAVPAALFGSGGSGAVVGRNRKSVILVFLTGASSHIDTFDPKPDAPAEIRGEFSAVSTKIPGVSFSEHVRGLAARTDRIAVVRSLAHRDDNHTAATHHLITGSIQPNVRFDKPLSRDDWPCYAGGVSYLNPPGPGVAAGVTLPTFLGEGPLIWPGQHGGFLGAKHDPWQITRNPNDKDFRVDNVQLSGGLAVDQLRDRMALLRDINAQRSAVNSSLEGRRLSDQQQRAAHMLMSGAVSRAFQIDQEPAAVRERYGRHMFGQSLLLARRLAEAGVPIVQANMGRVQNWDSHGNNFGRLKNDLLPPLDRAVSALLDDLVDRSLLNDVMVVVLGEFGRTPKVNGNQGGRDHWARCFSALFAGGGVQGGQVIGKSDKSAGDPVTHAISPNDVGATIYQVLGVDHEAEVRDRQDRPVQLNRGTPIAALFSGRGSN